MPFPAEHADALQWQVYSTELDQLSMIGTVSGVVPLAAAARNGPGMATVRSGANGTELSFRAPSSDTFGVNVDCAADGTYLLEDGEDANKWLRIQVHADYLPTGPEEANVRLGDRYANSIGMNDIAAADAASGKQDQWGYDLTNVSNVGLSNVRIWLDPVVQHIEIQDGGGWVTPHDEENALVVGDIPAGSDATVLLRRTIPASSGFDPSVLNHFHVSFDGL